MTVMPQRSYRCAKFESTPRSPALHGIQCVRSPCLLVDEGDRRARASSMQCSRIRGNQAVSGLAPVLGLRGLASPTQHAVALTQVLQSRT